MITCGNCGKSVRASDVTCPHCDSLLAAWTSAADAGQQSEFVQPDYARPSANNPLFPTMEITQSIGQSDSGDSGQDTIAAAPLYVTNKAAAAKLVTAIHAVDRATSSRLINTIRAYARKRERDLERTLAAAPKQHRSTPASSTSDSISNLAFAIGTLLVIVLILMWGIVATMVLTDEVSIEFIITTIILTLAFKPTMNNLRSAFK